MPLPGGSAIGVFDRRRDRPPGDQVALPAAALDRKREAHPPRAPGEHAVGEAEVAIRLGEHERQAQRERREPCGPRDVSAAAQHDLRAPSAQQAPCGRHCRRGQPDGIGSAHRVRAIQPAQAEEVDLIPRGRDQLGLRAVGRADERDLGALSP
jgi:hypothetical protein